MFYFIFSVLGFCLGSTMFAYWIPKLLKGIDICKLPEDHNPGVANAYMYGGFLLGTLALFCELAKGFVPVYFSQQFVSTDSLLFIPVMSAPVLGHAFPFFQAEKGGKSIAVSFGVMIGLFPEVRPLFYLIVFFLFFSLVLVIRPHSFRSVVTFGGFAFLVFLRVNLVSVKMGCFIIAVTVILKHLVKYQGELLGIRLFKHT